MTGVTGGTGGDQTHHTHTGQRCGVAFGGRCGVYLTHIPPVEETTGEVLVSGFRDQNLLLFTVQMCQI